MYVRTRYVLEYYVCEVLQRTGTGTATTTTTTTTESLYPSLPSLLNPALIPGSTRLLTTHIYNASIQYRYLTRNNQFRKQILILFKSRRERNKQKLNE